MNRNKTPSIIAVITALSLSLTTASFAEDTQSADTSTPSLKAYPGIEADIPKNWEVIEIIEGDLNKDKKADIVLRIDESDPTKIVKDASYSTGMIDNNRRGVLIFFNDGDRYRLVSKNLTGVIPSKALFSADTCMDDSLDGISIKNNVLRIKFVAFHSCGSYDGSEIEYIFRYQNQAFELIGLESSFSSRSTGETTTSSINFSTKKKARTTGGNMFEDNKSNPKTTWESIAINKLYRLKDWNEETYANILAKYE